MTRPAAAQAPRTTTRRILRTTAALLAAMAATTAAAAPAPASGSRAAERHLFGYITNYSQNTVTVLDPATNSAVHTIAVGKGPSTITALPGGRRLYVSDTNSYDLSEIDTATDTVVATIPTGGWVTALAVSPDGKRLYATNRSKGTVMVIDTATDTVVNTVAAPSIQDVAVAPDGKHVYLALGKALGILDPDTGTLTQIDAGKATRKLAVSPDGGRVYVDHYNDAQVSVLDTVTATVSPLATELPYPSGLTVSPDGTRLYVVGNRSSTLWALDTATGKTLGSASTGNFPGTVTLSPDGSVAYVTQSGSGGAVTVVDTATLTSTVLTDITSASGLVFATPPAADAAVKLTAGLLAGKLGTFTYTLTVTNNGPDTMDSATVTATLPEKATTTEDGCAVDDGAASCGIGPLEPGASTTRTFTAPLLTGLGNKFAATATKTASSPADPDTSNDTSTVTCTFGLTVACV